MKTKSKRKQTPVHLTNDEQSILTLLTKNIGIYLRKHINHEGTECYRLMDAHGNPLQNAYNKSVNKLIKINRLVSVNNHLTLNNEL